MIDFNGEHFQPAHTALFDAMLTLNPRDFSCEQVGMAIVQPVEMP